VELEIYHRTSQQTLYFPNIESIIITFHIRMAITILTIGELHTDTVVHPLYSSVNYFLLLNEMVSTECREDEPE
jgi:hypothetical protein